MSIAATIRVELLRPVVEPAGIGWWPQSPVSVWLSVLLLCGGAYLARSRYLAWQDQRYRRAALRALAALDSGVAPDAEYARQVSELLKRTAAVVWGEERVARLYGDAWQHFLASTACRTSRPLPNAPDFGALVYPREVRMTQAQRDQMRAFARAWIEAHSGKTS